MIIAQLVTISLYAQQFKRDFFNHLTYESARENFKAKLEKDIFNDLIYTDNNNNKVSYNNKYLSRTNSKVLSDGKQQEYFFEKLIKQYRNVKNRKEEFSIDMFENWIFESNLNNYKAEFKKDIFDARIFSDNRNNQISYDQKYIAKLKDNPFKSSIEQNLLFFDLIDRMINEKGYKADFKVDIFDKVIVSDNRGFKRESNDAFYILPEFDKENTIPSEYGPFRIQRVNKNEFIYRNNDEYARIVLNKVGRWNYDDSSGNKFQFSALYWNKLFQLYQTEEKVLGHLIQEYLY